MKNEVKEKLKKKFSIPTSDNAAVLEKAAKPGPTLDYSEHTRPTDSTTGKNKPIHNPYANRQPPKPATPTTPPKSPIVVTDQKTWVQQMGIGKKPENLQKSLKSKIATAAAAVAGMMPSKAEAPMAPASAASAPVAKPAASADEPVHETVAAPRGALVRIHTAHEFPQFLVSGKWHSPSKVSEMLDFLQKNPQHAEHYRSAVERMSNYRKASAGKGKEGFVYPK